MSVTARRGGKITSSHSTLTETSAEVANKAYKLLEVTKISLGQIKHVPGGRRDLKFLPIIGGIKAVIRGNGATQDLYLYTKQPDKVIQLLTKQFRK